MTNPHAGDCRRATALVCHYGNSDLGGVNEILKEAVAVNRVTPLITSVLDLYESMGPLLHTRDGLACLTPMIYSLAEKEDGDQDCRRAALLVIRHDRRDAPGINAVLKEAAEADPVTDWSSDCSACIQASCRCCTRSSAYRFSSAASSTGPHARTPDDIAALPRLRSALGSAALPRAHRRHQAHRPRPRLQQRVDSTVQAGTEASTVLHRLELNRRLADRPHPGSVAAQGRRQDHQVAGHRRGLCRLQPCSRRSPRQRCDQGGGPLGGPARPRR